MNQLSKAEDEEEPIRQRHSVTEKNIQGTLLYESQNAKGLGAELARGTVN
jgi:hypothetical protein